MAMLVQLVLSRFYQNVREIVHKWDEACRNFRVAHFVQPFAELEQVIIDSQQLLKGFIVDHHV
jgi:hypothetical protein